MACTLRTWGSTLAPTSTVTCHALGIIHAVSPAVKASREYIIFVLATTLPDFVVKLRVRVSRVITWNTQVFHLEISFKPYEISFFQPAEILILWVSSAATVIDIDCINRAVERVWQCPKTCLLLVHYTIRIAAVNDRTLLTVCWRNSCWQSNA